MSIIRVKRKRNNFAQIDTTPLRDDNLSWKARGILSFLMTKPDDWQINEANLIKQSKKDGRDALRSGIRELKEAGYIAKIFTRDDAGLITKWETIVFETIEDRDEWIKENPELARQLERSKTGENQQTGFPASSETSERGNQQTGFPASGKPVPIDINEITNDRVLGINEKRKNEPPLSLTASQEPEQPPEAVPQDISLAKSSSDRKEKESVPLPPPEVVPASPYSNPRHNSVANFEERFKARTSDPSHKYPELVRAGLGSCWIGPSWTDFDPWLVKAQVAFLKERNLPCKEGDAKSAISGYITKADWAKLEIHWKEAASLKERFDEAEKASSAPPAIASQSPEEEVYHPTPEEFARMKRGLPMRPTPEELGGVAS